MRRVAFLRGGTAAGIYDLRRLQIGRCGGLRKRALLAPDCCPCYPTFCPPSKKDDQIILLFVQVTSFSTKMLKEKRQTVKIPYSLSQKELRIVQKV